jgi:hypothetical protein
VLGRNIREESEATAIDSDERHVALGDVPRRVQQRAVTADRDDELGLFGELRRLVQTPAP